MASTQTSNVTPETDSSECLNECELNEFKKPILIVPKKGAHKFSQIKEIVTEDDTVKPAIIESESVRDAVKLAVVTGEPAPVLKYKEPVWSSAPTHKYVLEVLKSGAIVDTYNLDSNYFVFGRAVNANCVMLHQTISRHHAVLQYGQPEGEETPGFFLYDLNSTHGTFLNKLRIKPHVYVRMQVNHMIKLGLSSRLFILQGPPDDMEPESELSVTELKNMRLKKKLMEQLGKQKEEETNQGIDWGMGEDAEEDEELSVNPFAAAPNEELYIDDPKKTLRGWFEREGSELVYNCDEKGYGQFVCRVELPVDNPHGGGSLIAEATVRGKKKEAVVQCALEACRILDQHGLLRQATHESKKKKAKNWEAEDFYDSDEDVFLDRTGTVERKRQKRMQAAGVGQVVHTYPELMAEHALLVEQVGVLEKSLEAAAPPKKEVPAVEDELDKFMATLESAVVDKAKVASLKLEIARLKADEVRVRKLANVARPAGTPELLPPWSTEASPAPAKKMQPIMIGKRPNLMKKFLIKKPQPAAVKQTTSKLNDDEEEFDSE